ncbi:hypothetical protein IV417_10995 [Alphaproteobacteria bacterium KMM 3653]|uniref:Uncharacterized protein n=1 Tax=Harenicola maris TaxID=2841044 RepID=A0AAP2CUH6_9RHOB|nr:hypothetical protein [Harenicola maris]
MQLSPTEMTQLWEDGKTFSATAEELFATREIPQFPATQAELDEQMLRASKLVAELAAGKLIALGFPSPPRAGDTPLAIPREAWNDECTVEVSMYGTLQHGDHAYIKVRICVPASYVTKTNGRPTLKRIFEDAFEDMARSGEINLSNTQTSHTALLRERATALHPLHKVFIENSSERAAMKYFSPLFRELNLGEK